MIKYTLCSVIDAGKDAGVLSAGGGGEPHQELRHDEHVWPGVRGSQRGDVQQVRQELRHDEHVRPGVRGSQRGDV